MSKNAIGYNLIKLSECAKRVCAEVRGVFKYRVGCAFSKDARFFYWGMQEGVRKGCAWGMRQIYEGVQQPCVKYIENSEGHHIHSVMSSFLNIK